MNKAKADVLVNAGDTSYSGNLFQVFSSTAGHSQWCVTHVQCEGPGQPNSRMAFTGDALVNL